MPVIMIFLGFLYLIVIFLETFTSFGILIFLALCIASWQCSGVFTHRLSMLLLSIFSSSSGLSRIVFSCIFFHLVISNKLMMLDCEAMDKRF